MQKCLKHKEKYLIHPLESREGERKYDKWEIWNKLEETSPNLYSYCNKCK